MKKTTQAAFLTVFLLLSSVASASNINPKYTIDSTTAEPVIDLVNPLYELAGD